MWVSCADYRETTAYSIGHGTADGRRSDKMSIVFSTERNKSILTFCECASLVILQGNDRLSVNVSEWRKTG